jgi:hypothetical protein
MSPVSITRTTQSGQIYETPFTGPIDHTVQIAVPLSALTANEIDDYGYLRPGVPLTRAGALVGASPAFVYGVTIEAIKVLADNESATIAAAGTVQVAVAVIGVVRQAVAEDQLERAYTANEIAGFDRAGSKLVLVTTA